MFGKFRKWFRMYVDVKMGMRGELVIPAFIRKKFRLTPGETVKLDVGEESLQVVVKNPDVVAWFKEYAKKEGIPDGEIVYGDKLYEEVLG